MSRSPVQAGNIIGTVKDAQGGALPGVTVTLEGTGPGQSFVTESDGRYRFLNLPPGPYRVTATLPGFQTMVRDGVVVAVGQNVNLPLELGVAAVVESVTVTGESPIVDTKAMGTATNFTQDELSRVPNSRDPWALLRTVPGVSVDRVNIAGNGPASRRRSSRRADARAMRSGRWTACRSPTWRRRVGPRPTSTTTPSTRSRSRRAATTSGRRPAAWASTSS